MPISFPANPSVNDTFTSGNRTWRWNGSSWMVVTGTALAGDVGTSDIADSSITTEKLAAGAVEESNIASSAITEAKIAPNAITTAKLGTDVQLGYRNVIINGGFDVWQRGTTTTVTGSAYLADRFRGSVNGGGGGIQSRDTDVPSGQGFLYSWKHAATVTNSFMQMGQQIEFVNCKHLQNKTVTISFWAKAINSNAGSTGLFVRTRTIAGVDGIVLFAGSASATSITLTTSWARYTITKLLPASFGSLSLEFAIGSHVSGDGFFLTGVQLEAGAVATPFEFEGYGVTLAKCQRYYWRNSAVNTHSFMSGAGVGGSSTGIGLPVETPVIMRTAPTSIEWSTLTCTDTVAANITPSALGIQTITNGQIVGLLAIVTGATTYRVYHLISNVSTSGYLGISAEF